MSDIIISKESFPIENPEAVSVRLFFAKESEVSRRWHICDASLGQQTPNGIYYMALHGRPIHPTVKCDSVLQAKLRLGGADLFCYRCLDEFEIARDIIEQRRLMRFR